ncbi:protein FAR1-RELATED SEQUENCE 5-like [Olea europaea var. sylvestris]|uniref:protein FAR1-RELATED SEQUENCE 5-like n=1 Tax=Olea europaea var. sylvestris TaxID=158386 RepID=UPI000C1D29E3|nr:protein FAR1-RELATED SEQUENCE 5-like [Olea europaea var. sylvestris]
MEGGIDDFLLETEDEIVAENRNIVEDEMLGDDGIVVPKIGMIFSSENEMFELYKEYAYSVGFPVKKRNSKKGSGGVLRFVTYTCGREGRRPSTATGSVRPQPTIQTNCKARISASSDDHGSWRINAVHLDHNHGTSPSKSRLFRCNRELSAQATSTSSKGKRYLTNKYDMPFAPFVGVNHHGQSTLLGCDLLSNEDTNSFVWLFRSWLQCIHSVAPHGIITDQDRAMQNAIQIVFPNTNHRWCLWHILKKLPEKFGYHIDKGSIFSDIHGLVYDSQFVEEFEEGWIAMINKFGLHENDWLSGLYENRKRWVPCFLKTTFWAGMSTTQRSESMNAFFDGYVHSKTSLKQFVEQYERALRNKVEKEFQADFKSYSQMLPCDSRNFDDSIATFTVVFIFHMCIQGPEQHIRSKNIVFSQHIEVKDRAKTVVTIYKRKH